MCTELKAAGWSEKKKLMRSGRRNIYLAIINTSRMSLPFLRLSLCLYSVLEILISDLYCCRSSSIFWIDGFPGSPYEITSMESLNRLKSARVSAFTLGILVAFFLGLCIGKLCQENRWVSGLKYAFIAFLGAIISHLVADLLRIL